MKFYTIYNFFKKRLEFRDRIGVTNTVFILSLFIGILGGTTAVILKNLLHFTSSLLYRAFPDAKINYLYLAFPLIGIILTMLFVKKIVKDDLSHGVSIVLKNMFSKGGKIKLHHTYSSMIASSITVGFGGSVGMEAPIVLTGSAVGSNLAKLFNLSSKHTRLLLACGSTAALAAIFQAPITGIVFALEVLMLDLTASALLPLLIAAVTGTVISTLFLGSDVMLHIPGMEAFHIMNIPYYIILGGVAGLISVYFMRIIRVIERAMKKIKRSLGKAIIGGIFLGGLIFLFPVFYGEGYEFINALINNNQHLLFSHSPLFSVIDKYWAISLLFISIIFIKAIASAITNSSGGVGGVFAPSLFVGAFLGFFVADLSIHIFGIELPVVNFILSGMAGVMSGVMFAPLTGIFLIAELTSGYNLLLPLMITSSISYIVVRKFEQYSIYTKPLADIGELMTHNKDSFAMKAINWKSQLDTNISTISIHASLREYTHCIANSKRNIFVVLDDNSLFTGLLIMDDHRDIIFNTELYDSVGVKELMIQPELFIFDTDSGEDVIRKFNQTKNFNMPVITIQRKYLGFLSKAKVLSLYREFIAEESED